MGCETITHTDGKRYFIPDCWGAVVHGKHACTCHQVGSNRLNDTELIQHLKEENKRLKNEIKRLQK